MKHFFQTVFATFLSLLLFCTVVVLVCIGLVIGLARLGSKQEPKIERGAFLVVDMSMNITDTPPPSDEAQRFGHLFGGDDTPAVSLRETLDAINAAAKDDRIAGIFLHGSFAPSGYGTGFAALKEVREALTNFRTTSKKPVAAYLVEPSTRDYYLTSAADKVYLNPFGVMQLQGLATEPMFFADAFKKYGVDVQVTRVGKYKSFVEPYILDKMSPENREQTQTLLDDLWNEIKGDVAQSRSLTPDQVQALTDKEGLINAADAKEGKLVDDLIYLPDVIERLRKQTGTTTTPDERDTFKQVALSEYIKDKVGKSPAANSKLAAMMDSSPKIAVVYAEGDIVDGDGTENADVGGDRYARELRRLREDGNVKAILLRVNSPGGSAVASEVIQRELALTQQGGKPVVVSMGTVAASGGYWITTAADRVFAEPSTITGSIGVFGILPSIQGLANSYGVTFDGVKTGKYADLFTVSRPKTPDELAVVQGMVDHIYDQFIGRVATARKLAPERVQEIAQGRVWSGTEALKLGLVNEIGGLEQALAYTKTKAGLPPDAKIVEYPAPKEFAEQVAELFSGERRPVAAIKALVPTGTHAGPLAKGLGQMQDQLSALGRLNDPTGTYARLPFEMQIK